MIKYLKAENLKYKRRFVKYLIFLAPSLVLLHAALTYVYYIPNGYNWWYIIILPSFIALSSSLINSYEYKGLKYQAVFSLPVSIKKTWVSKIILLSVYLSVSSLFHLIMLILGKATFFSEPAKDILYLNMIFASFTLIITHLWQIPFCLFLSKKIGTAFTVLINAFAGMAVNIIFVNTKFWWISPYSWASRLMIPIIKVLPNGLIAENINFKDYRLDVFIGIILPILLFFLLINLTKKWFQKQEVE
ncbi:MAG: lantibiotic immunity ABC transporter MutE/EpiE family permease subunit [Tissierellia bacterium]|nr:lantibiotic immunity ABC transporter MutE/EpiE family permease subunit [Tissierellia bacterium]